MSPRSLGRFLAPLVVLALAPTARAASACADSCWTYTQVTAGDAETPKDVQKVLQANHASPAVKEAVERIAIYSAAGVTPAVTIQASHWETGYFTWTGPSACGAGDARLKTPTQFFHAYCLSNSMCVPGGPAAPAEKDPCAP